MDANTKKVLGYLLVTVGPCIGLSNFMVVVYRNFSDQSYMHMIPQFYHTSSGNFTVGFIAMSLVLFGKSLLRSSELYKNMHMEEDVMEMQQI